MKSFDDIPLELKKIIRDNKSGSSALQSKLSLFFLKNSKDFTRLKKSIPLLKEELKSFSGIISFLTGLEKFTSPVSAEIFLTRQKDNNELLYGSLYKKIFPLIKKCSVILTLSNSTTVYEILTRHKKNKNNFKVIIAESRPKLEGRVLAEKLVKAGIKIEFITDAMLPAFIEKCDCVLIGADQILKNGNIVNKAGSRNAAILCKEFNKPFYVIADKSKITNKNNYSITGKPSGEVWDTNNTLIKVHNYYFEEVEKKYITKIITD